MLGTSRNRRAVSFIPTERSFGLGVEPRYEGPDQANTGLGSPIKRGPYWSCWSTNSVITIFIMKYYLEGNQFSVGCISNARLSKMLLTGNFVF